MPDPNCRARPHRSGNRGTDKSARPNRAGNGGQTPGVKRGRFALATRRASCYLHRPNGIAIATRSSEHAWQNESPPFHGGRDRGKRSIDVCRRVERRRRARRQRAAARRRDGDGRPRHGSGACFPGAAERRCHGRLRCGHGAGRQRRRRGRQGVRPGRPARCAGLSPYSRRQGGRCPRRRDLQPLARTGDHSRLRGRQARLCRARGN